MHDTVMLEAKGRPTAVVVTSEFVLEAETQRDALGIIITLNVETGVVTPPVGLNIFAVSGTSKIPLMQVLKGTIPFFIGDLTVLLLVIFFPGLATWLPNQLITDVFK